MLHLIFLLYALSFMFYNLTMKLESAGIIIGLRPFGERDMVAHIFTREFGMLAGMMKGAAVAKKNRPLVGQVGAASWNARLDSALGAFHWESSRNMAAPLMNDAETLAIVNSAFALIHALLPEREKYTFLYDRTIDLLDKIGNHFLKFGNEATTPPLGGVGARSCGPVGGQHNPEKRNTELALHQAQNLRKNMTSAEKLLWHYLKDNKMGYAFRKQCPINKYIADFVCLEKRLIIELDGEQHYEEGNRMHDVERTKILNGDGYRIIRFDNRQVFKDMDGVLRVIHEYLCPPTASRGAETTLALCDSPQGGSNSALITSELNEHLTTPPLGGVGAHGCGPVGGQDGFYKEDIHRLYLDWEIWLLRELGYALDLSRCSNCGRTDNLTHLSPRTGRAVCRTCAAPYDGRLFELPVDLDATKYFLNKIAQDQGGRALPHARQQVKG